MNYNSLNLKRKKIKKLMRPSQLEAAATELILDENELQRLDNIENYGNLEILSASCNNLIRMYGISRLVHLTSLNLSQNNILSIEGLKDLIGLQQLNLSRNCIRTIEHLKSNLQLRVLDLSDNSICFIGDLSYLRLLKELLLQGNKISHLKMCNEYLPESVQKLTLANNKLADLNEISLLTHLVHLEHFSIANNPCVLFSDSRIAFNYRPFILNWCLTLKSIDGVPIGSLENLKAEWLYSQGKGRHFRIGDHEELSKYLMCTCPPLSNETAWENEDDRKLRLILNKAQQHQKQLISDQLSYSAGNSPSSSVGRRMASSFENSHSGSNGQHLEKYMSQSLDSSTLRKDLSIFGSVKELPCSATKFVPVLESLISPDCRTPDKSLGGKALRKSDSATLRKSAAIKKPFISNRRCASAVVTSSSPVSARSRVSKSGASAERTAKAATAIPSAVDRKTIDSAVLIQKTWRGYRVRKSNLLKDIQLKRCQDHLQKLAFDLAQTKESLASEKKTQQLQTQALNAIWQKIATSDLGSEVNGELKNGEDVICSLAKSCRALASQMEQFQSSIQTLTSLMTTMCQTPRKDAAFTQTDLIAVHTPKDENSAKFPFTKH